MSSLAPSGTPILEMPLEVIDHIERGISKPQDRIAFASTCSALFKRYHLPAVFSRLEKHLVHRCSHGRFQNTKLFCLAHARKGEPGRKPFLITSLVMSPNRTHIRVGLTQPSIGRHVRDHPTRSYIFVNTEGKRAVMYPDYVESLPHLGNGIYIPNGVDHAYWEGNAPTNIPHFKSPFSRDLRFRTKEVDWRATMAGRLVPATVKLLRKRSRCPECKGRGKIDSRGFHDQWPDLGPYPFSTDVSCPRCAGYHRTMNDLNDYAEQVSNEYSDLDEAEVIYGEALHELYHSGL